MSREVVRVQANGHDYAITPWKATEAGAIALIIGRALGGVLGALFTRIGGGKVLDAEIDKEAMIGALGKIPQAVIEEGGMKLALRMLSGTKRRSEIDAKLWDEVSDQVIFDEVYAQNLGEMLEILWKLIDVNYGPFSGESGGILIGALRWFATMSGAKAETAQP